MDRYHFFELRGNEAEFLCSHTCTEKSAEEILNHFKEMNPKISFRVQKQILNKEEEIEKHKAPRV